MNRYAQLFSRLDAVNQGAFVPFVMLGDPTPELSLAIVDALVEGGADALELGIPFSDPVADGPTIQGAAVVGTHERGVGRHKINHRHCDGARGARSGDGLGHRRTADRAAGCAGAGARAVSARGPRHPQPG